MEVRTPRLLLVTAVIAVLGAFPANGQSERLIAKLSPSDLTPSLTKAIADVGVSTKFKVGTGDTLRWVVLSHCQRDDPNFLALLMERSESFGIPTDKISADYKFSAEATLELPYCLRFEPQEPDWSAFPLTAGLDSNDRFGAIAATAMARAAGDARDYDEREYVEVPLRGDVMPEEATASVNSGIPEEKKVRPQQKGIRHITVLTAEEDKCADTSAKPEKYPVDTYAILRVLGLNRAVKPEHASPPMPLIIGDSGLYYDDRTGIFTEANVETRPYAVRTPAATYARSQHGTYVATAALGGPYFMRFASLAPLKIRARNIISKVQGCEPVGGEAASTSPGMKDYCEIEDELLSDLMSASTTGAIVNLSVSHAGEIKGLEKELLLAEGRSLVVAAAGNTGVPVTNDSYPAKLAQLGEHKDTILIVSALESDGKSLSKTSSYHPRWVELAAYGCKIPVYEFVEGDELAGDAPQFKIVRQSGTSMAAPIVTFAASLLKTQMDMTPALLKRRLLVSADYEPGLANKVKNNARLNIPRALALFHDVVALEGSEPIYGRIKNGNFLIRLCGGRESKRRSDLRSLSIFDENGAKKVFFYYGAEGEQQKRDAALEREDCLLSEPNPDDQGFDLANYKLTIEDAETGLETEFALKDVNNITFAYAPYWEK